MRLKGILAYVAPIILLILSQQSCSNDDQPQSAAPLKLLTLSIGLYSIDLTKQEFQDVPVDKSFNASFDAAVSTDNVEEGIRLVTSAGTPVPLTFTFFNENRSIRFDPDGRLQMGQTYRLILGVELRSQSGGMFQPQEFILNTKAAQLNLLSFEVDAEPAGDPQNIRNVPVEAQNFEFSFDVPVLASSVNANTVMLNNSLGTPQPLSITVESTKIIVNTVSRLDDFKKYSITVTEGVRGVNNEKPATSLIYYFFTGKSPSDDFASIPDNELLTKVQQQTFRYFWDFAHPASGMARERTTSGDLVTSGGSGFGIMALIVGVERGFITRTEALTRMDKILDFLETADRFHGAWSHWMNGNTGDVIPFSANDNGGDIVETSFLVQGLITFRQYLNAGAPEEASLITRINNLWHAVEWSWYRRDGQNVLYWHWSPDKQWAMNHQVKGYNECLITYVLAASSPTHSIPGEVYHQGWASNGSMANGKSFYGTTLPLGYDYGGPLFFSHYSFLGLDPRNLSDQYANYWTQNVNHSVINHQHSVVNPKNFVGYSDENWGLTASDNHQGYSAHSPTNDLGVISPTAALSSFPYTPEQSMKALKFFYYKLGDRLWGEYGFYDAFNLTEQWTASQYLAIDQGPIVVMIENYRTGLLWNLFMSAPEVQTGLTKLNFSY